MVVKDEDLSIGPVAVMTVHILSDFLRDKDTALRSANVADTINIGSVPVCEAVSDDKVLRCRAICVVETRCEEFISPHDLPKADSLAVAVSTLDRTASTANMIFVDSIKLKRVWVHTGKEDCFATRSV